MASPGAEQTYAPQGSVRHVGRHRLRGRRAAVPPKPQSMPKSPPGRRWWDMLEAMISVGSTIGGYHLERVLGIGGMGTVYLAKSPTLPRKEAVKVLSTELSGDPSFRERLVREAEIAARLDHPNIVSIYGRGETAGQLWISMQFVDGSDAETALRSGAMTPQRAIHIVTETAKALDFAHHHNFLHHDVKPANLLLRGSGAEEQVLLSDFGVALPLDDTERAPDTAFTATLAYSAPEAISGARIDGRSDQYSLGCTLFRLLTGRQPFAHVEGDAATIRAHLEEPPPRVSDHVWWATAELDQVIARALAKNPAHRYASAASLAAAATEAVRHAGAPSDAAPYRAATAEHPAIPTGLDSPRPPERPVSAAPLADPAAVLEAGPKPIKRPATPAEASLALDSPRPPERPVPAAPLADPAAVLEAGAKPNERPTTRTESAPAFGEIPNIWANIPSPQLSKPLLWGGAAAVVVVSVLAIILVNTWGGSSPASPPTSPPQAAASEAEAPSPGTADPAARTRLDRLIPSGYPPGACTPQHDLPSGTAAQASCTANIDPGGPASAIYTLAGDDRALSAAFDQVVSEAATVVCPGNIQSPGPWRRSPNPKEFVGMLYCGVRDGNAVVAWTTSDDLLLAVTKTPQSDLAALYRWWTSHS